MADRELIVRVIGDDRSLQQMFARDQKAVQKFGVESELAGGRFAKFNQALRGGLSGFGGRSSLLFGSGAFLSTAAISAGIKESVDAASDLNEQITKSQAVFGDASKAVLEWSKTTAKALGVSREAALEAAGTFGNLFVAQGFGAQQAADLSRRLTKLASDLASFNNVDPGQVLEDLRSGLVGEVEPLRKYGSNLLAARVQQEALRESGKQTVKDLSDQDKTLARIALLYKDTASAQGDFAKTSGGLANQQRILSAQVKDLEASFGSALLPSVKAGVTGLNDLAGAAESAITALHKLGDVKIPVINVPLSLDTGGGGGGPFGFLGDVAKIGPLFELSPALFYTALAKKIIGTFNGSKPAATADLAGQFKQVLGGYFQDALDQSTSDIPTPKVKGPVGFATGATPEDILGPLITDIPKKLQEALLDVEIASPNDREAIVAALEKQRNSLLNALDDPRLTKDQTIDLKRKLLAVQGAISSEKDAIQSAVEQANAKRAAALDAAVRKTEEAKQEQIAKLEKIREAREEAVERAREILQGKQFKALGLAPTGDEIVPGIDNLGKRINAILSKVSSGDLDIGSKLADRLRAARKLINTEGDKLTKDTRSKINDFIKAVNGKDATEKIQGPLTKNSVFQANKIIEGLGLTPDMERIIRQRVNAFNNADVRLPFKTPSVGAAGAVPHGIEVTNINTITLDGDVVGRNVTRSQQKKSRRNSVQKRGPNRNI